MNVTSYIYQSPSPQAVQVGRPDSSAKSSDSSASTANTATDLSSNETFQDAQSFKATQESEVKPTVKVDTGNTLDIYA